MQNNTVFRITVYHPGEDFCAILDSPHFFKTLWEFSSFAIKHGFKVVDATTSDNFTDVNIGPCEHYVSRIVVRACAKGPVERLKLQNNKDGSIHDAIKVNTRIYITG